MTSPIVQSASSMNSAQSAQSSQVEPCLYRLSNAVVPQHYHLHITVNSELSATEVSEQLDFHLSQERPFIVLNARNLAISAASLSGGTLESAVQCLIEIEAENDRVLFIPPANLAAGDYSLDLKFTGKINDKDLRGFYQTHSDKGITAATQFESTNARMAFVCVDQPGFEETTEETPKAKYSVSLTIPEHLQACSVGDVESTTMLGNGFKTIVFTESVPIATYVVVFIVGNIVPTEPVVYRSISGKDIPIRIWHEPGQEKMTSFALKCAAFSLEFYEKLFAIPYQGPILNLVSLKDFMFGAMENHCSHTFREAAILTDEATASITTLKRIAEIIAHEIGHNWFGNLVTMSWWHGVTAKEMMATFISHLCIDAWKPEFKMWNSFLKRRSNALSTDSLHHTRCVEAPVGSPEEAEAMYDSLTYEKGCALNYMLLQYLGIEVYAKGCQIYLGKAMFNNADLPDFWAAMSKASGKDVEAIMPAWFHQKGVPAIYISERTGGILSSQLPFTYLTGEDNGGENWPVPIVLRTGKGEKRLLLDRASGDADLNEVDYVVGNAGAGGYYRTFYSPSLLTKLLAHVSELSIAEQYTLINDMWAGVLAGKISLQDYLAVLPKFKDTLDTQVWSLIGSTLEAIGGLFSGTKLASYRQFVSQLVSPIYKDPQTSNDGQLQSQLVILLSNIAEDAEVQKECQALLEQYLQDRTSVDANLISTVVFAVAHKGDMATFERYLHLRETGETPQEKLNFTYGLAMFPDAQLVQKALEMTVNGKVRSQDAAALISFALKNSETAQTAWTFTKDNWTTLSKALPAPLLVRIIGAAASLSTEEDLADVQQFIAANPIAGFELPVQQCLERQQVNVLMRRNNVLAAAQCQFPSL